MDRRGLVALDEVHVVAVALEQAADRLVGRAAEHGRAGDLVAVEVKDRQHRAVARRVEETDALPRAFERRGLGFAVADDRDRDQVGVVEHGAERVGEHVAELAAFVDRAGRRRADVARDAARRRELAEQPLSCPISSSPMCGIDLGVRALEIDVRDDRRTAVAGTGEEDHVRRRDGGSPG